MSTHVIVGAGQAGACAAVAMRQIGFEGRIVLVGREPGLPYEKPPLSKNVLAGAAGTLPPVIFREEAYSHHSIETRFGIEVADADPQARTIALANGETIVFDRLLLATGGRARRLDLPGAEHIATLRTLDDAQRIRSGLEDRGHVVCIGAGVIGLEFAAVARAKGCRVTVVELGSAVMERILCSEVQRFLEEFHRHEGVTFRFGARPVAVELLEDGRKRMMLEDGAEIEASLIVAGVGMERDVALARRLGVDVDNGILVDEFGRTSNPDIFAAGDVAAFWHPALRKRLRLEAWRHAQNHGIAVGQNMAGANVPYQDVPWLWTDQYGLTIQISGLPKEADHCLYQEGEKPGSFVGYHLGRDNAVVGATAINAPRQARAAQALIRMNGSLPDKLRAELKSSLQAAARAHEHGTI